jgi:hypothetical protein
MTNENEMTKAQLIERIETSWEELQAVLSRLDEAAMRRADSASGWAVTDHLTHLAAWERGIAYLLTHRPRHEGMGISAEQWRDLTMDEINEVVHEAGQGRVAAEALAIFRQSHTEMLDALAELGDADLMRDYSAYDQDSAPSGRPIIGWIIGNTYDHYEEHLGYIRAVIAR